MEPILPLTTLLRNPGKVKDAAKESIVRITEHGEGAYIFATEESFEAYVRRQREEAAFEERLARSVEQGLEEAEAGRVSDDLEGLFARVEAKFEEETHDG